MLANGLGRSATNPATANRRQHGHGRPPVALLARCAGHRPPGRHLAGHPRAITCQPSGVNRPTTGNTSVVLSSAARRRCDRHRHHQRHHRRPDHQGAGPTGPARPLGYSHLADHPDRHRRRPHRDAHRQRPGVGSTRGIDWIELFIQIALAAAGVAWSPGGTPSAEGAFDALGPVSLTVDQGRNPSSGHPE
jgi:hypothetical protein